MKAGFQVCYALGCVKMAGMTKDEMNEWLDGESPLWKAFKVKDAVTVEGKLYAFMGGKCFPPESLLFLDDPPVAVLPPTHWKCPNHIEPFVNPWNAEKCECCGRAKS